MVHSAPYSANRMGWCVPIVRYVIELLCSESILANYSSKGIIIL